MIRLLLMMAAMAAGLCAVHADAGQKRPFRGAVGISVLLCKYKDAPAPAKSRQFYEDMMINKNKGAHADYWRDVSNGSITLKGSVVKGWYTLAQTEAEARAYGGGGSKNRTKKHSDYVDKAKTKGYTPPSDHLVVVVSSPGIDTFGIWGEGAFVKESAGVGVLAHEVGHGLSLGTYIFGLILGLTEFSGRHNMKGDTMECLGRIASGMFGKRLTYKGLIG